MFRAGAAVDVKGNLLPSMEAFAVAPRLRLGYAVPEDSSVVLAEAGAIGSYRFWDCLEPYVALGFANHWLDYPVDTLDLESNQSLASRKGYGDGLVKGHVGIDASLWRGLGVLTEYGFWKTLQNESRRRVQVRRQSRVCDGDPLPRGVAPFIVPRSSRRRSAKSALASLSAIARTRRRASSPEIFTVRDASWSMRELCSADGERQDGRLTITTS